MWSRCGYFIGTVKPGRQAEFDAIWDGVLADNIRNYPGVRSFQLFRGRWREAGCPEIYQMTVLTLDSPEAIDAMLVSPERAQNLERVERALTLFDGCVVHVNYEITAVR